MFGDPDEAALRRMRPRVRASLIGQRPHKCLEQRLPTAALGACDQDRHAVLQQEQRQPGELRVEHAGRNEPGKRRDDVGGRHGRLRG